MTQQQQDRISKAFADYTAASAAKTQAERADAVAGAAMDRAKEFARVGVLVEIQKLQDKANADAAAAVAEFNRCFQAACDATNAWGAALKEFQDATANSMTTPGVVEKVA